MRLDFADHARRHADARMAVRRKRVQKILRDGQIGFGSRRWVGRCRTSSLLMMGRIIAKAFPRDEPLPLV